MIEIRKLTPGDRILDYRILESIGEGGFGEVFRAEHEVLDRVVAIKVPRDLEALSALRLEGVIQSRLDHPGIVKTLDICISHDPPYVVMEYVDGSNLRRMIEQGPIPWTRALDLLLQVCRALDYAHKQGVVHGDIKPGNILVESDSGELHTKITDFGLGRVFEGTQQANLQISRSLNFVESATEVMGTLRYLAPEVQRGEGADEQSDVYSIGVLLFEMLTGSLPEGRDVPSDLKRSVPAGLDDVFCKCYVRKSRRYKSLTELCKDLETLRHNHGRWPQNSDQSSITETRVLNAVPVSSQIPGDNLAPNQAPNQAPNLAPNQAPNSCPSSDEHQKVVLDWLGMPVDAEPVVCNNNALDWLGDGYDSQTNTNQASVAETPGRQATFAGTFESAIDEFFAGVDPNQQDAQSCSYAKGYPQDYEDDVPYAELYNSRVDRLRQRLFSEAAAVLCCQDGVKAIDNRGFDTAFGVVNDGDPQHRVFASLYETLDGDTAHEFVDLGSTVFEIEKGLWEKEVTFVVVAQNITERDKVDWALRSFSSGWWRRRRVVLFDLSEDRIYANEYGCDPKDNDLKKQFLEQLSVSHQTIRREREQQRAIAELRMRRCSRVGTALTVVSTFAMIAIGLTFQGGAVKHKTDSQSERDAQIQREKAASMIKPVSIPAEEAPSDAQGQSKVSATMRPANDNPIRPDQDKPRRVVTILNKNIKISLPVKGPERD